jgi:hypothetical protein
LIFSIDPQETGRQARIGTGIAALRFNVVLSRLSTIFPKKYLLLLIGKEDISKGFKFPILFSWGFQVFLLQLRVLNFFYIFLLGFLFHRVYNIENMVWLCWAFITPPTPGIEGGPWESKGGFSTPKQASRGSRSGPKFAGCRGLEAQVLKLQ